MKLSNPVITDNSKSRDPFLVQYQGEYYSCYGYKEKVVVRRFPTLDKIVDAEEKSFTNAMEQMPKIGMPPKCTF